MLENKMLSSCFLTFTTQNVKGEREVFGNGGNETDIWIIYQRHSWSLHLLENLRIFCKLSLDPIVMMFWTLITKE